MADGDQIRVPKRAVLDEEKNRIEAGRLVTTYESHEFDIPTPLTSPTSIKAIVDHSVDCTCRRIGGPFALIQAAQRVSLRNMSDPTTGAPVVVRLNAASADLFTLDAGEYADWDFVETRDLFFTNESGQAVPIRVALA